MERNHDSRNISMRSPKTCLLMLSIAGILLAGSALTAAAQLSPSQPDPLARMREAAGAQACSTDDSSACAAAAPKIISSALGASPLAENLRRLTDEIGGGGARLPRP